MHPIIREYCAAPGAYSPRQHTDTFFPLKAGSYDFVGPLLAQIKFIERRQLLDTELWKLFVNQFRQGNVDDADKGWRCEYWGKMMRGGCFVWQTDRNPELYEALKATVLDMLSVQDENGRFSTYSPENEFDGWDIWGRKYILLGMQYFMEICTDSELNARILNALRRHMDYIIAHIGPAEEGKKEINEATTYWHGLNSSSVLEPVVRMYNLTGEKRYLDFADYIVARGGTSIANIFEMAYADELDPYQYPVTKAYEMMSCFEGLLEYYRVTGIEKWKLSVIRFARRVSQSDITVIGCAGCTHELFDHSSVRQLDITEKGIMQETCVTVTWMKLCNQVLCLTGDAYFADCMERSMYNALPGAINSDCVTTNGGLPFDSYSPLLPGLRGRKMGGYKTMENGTYYGCCACIGAAGLGLSGTASAMCAQDGIVLNQYLPGTIHTCTPSGSALELEIRTAYPADGHIRMIVKPEKAEEFALYLRIPQWSEKTELVLCGEKIAARAGEYTILNRLWQKDDAIELELDMRIMPIRPEDYGVSSEEAPYMALRRGPLVLARDARLGQDVDAPVRPILNEDGSIAAELTDASPVHCVVSLNVALSDGTGMPMIDYASAGKTWSDESKMCAWFLLAK